MNRSKPIIRTSLWIATTARRVSVLIALFGVSILGQATESSDSLDTFLASYVKIQDPSYEWSIKQDLQTEQIRYVLVELTSQTWLTQEEVNRTDWRHWLEIYIPNNRVSDVSLLFISGGSNSGGEPQSSNSVGQQIALVSKTIVAQLSQVPNQPLVFLNDGKERSEDDLISFSWIQYLETKRLEWLAQAAMVKSAVRAMDAVTEVLASEELGAIEADEFVVAGGSKRGWTTWLTAIVDSRVVGIVPVVFDVLNMRASMSHHFGAYGFWSASMGDYFNQGILRELQSDKLDALLQVVDPYNYLDGLDIPKFIVNGAGDEFFLLDSSQFYWSELIGPKYLRYVPNADHGLGSSDALQSVAAFVSLAAQNKPIPSIDWTRKGTNRIQIQTSAKPYEAKLWIAHNPVSRDFRLLRGSDGMPRGPVFAESSLISSSEDGLVFEASVETPSKGWSAWLAEFEFDVGLSVPLKLSTDVQVLPIDLPFASKEFTQENFLTIHCLRNHDDEQIPERVLKFIDGTVGSSGPIHRFVSNRDYYTWKQTEDLRVEGTAVTGFLNSIGYEECRYQLESGEGPTVPPLLDRKD